MKKFILVILCIFISLSFLGASDFHYIFRDVGYHPNFLFGLFPTYVLNGFDYTGLQFLKNNSTTLQFRYYTGITRRTLWQNPQTGVIDINSKPISYDVLRNELEIGLNQGFGPKNENNRDIFRLGVTVDFKWEANKDPYGGEKDYLDKVLVNLNPQIYPDLYDDKRHHLQLGISTSIVFDYLTYQGLKKDGFQVSFYFKWAPAFINHNFYGASDYFYINIDVLHISTLFSQGSKWNLLLYNYLNFGYTDGKAVPTHAQYDASLGGAVKGFNTLTYNTNFLAAYNLELHLIIPELFGFIRPYSMLYYSVGVNAGNIINTSIKQNELLMSVGAQATINIFNFVDFTYQYFYLIDGVNYGLGLGNKHNHIFYMYVNLAM